MLILNSQFSILNFLPLSVDRPFYGWDGNSKSGFAASQLRRDEFEIRNSKLPNRVDL